MEGFGFAMWLTAIVEVIVLICFFVLCHNIKEIRKLLCYFKGKDYIPKFKVGEKFNYLGYTATISKVRFDGETFLYYFKEFDGGTPEYEIKEPKYLPYTEEQSTADTES